MEVKKLKVVVVSDSSSTAIYIESTIYEALPGAEVYVALDELQGASLAKIAEPDLILVDISLLRKADIQIDRIFKNDKTLQLTPMLFVTDWEADRELHSRAIEAGAEAFLFKPIDRSLLITQCSAMAKIKERNVLISAQKVELEALVEQRTSALKREIAERERLEIELRSREEIFRSYIEKAPIGIFVTDAAGKYIEANAVACQMMGRAKNEVLQLSLSDFLIPDHLEQGIAGFSELTNKGFIDTEYRVRKKDNQEYWISLRATKINDNCFIAFCSDISDRKEKEARVEYLIYHDSLTGVHNRAYYEKELSILDTEENLPFSVILSDVNGLKLINDSMGHAAGDKVLVETAKLLRGFKRGEDRFARVGGDEFTLLLPRTSNEEAQTIVSRIQSACRQYKVHLLEAAIPLSVSLGYATKTGVAESFSSISKLAEDHMYRRKLLERESFHSTLLETLRVSLFERNHETEEHAARLIGLSRKLGRVMGLNKNALNDLELLSTLHDIGKISIDNSILLKPDKLSASEWVEMKKHPSTGYRIAMASTELRSIAEYIHCHHERWDGKGYPQGLSGESIPLLSRVISIVDAYDAMVNDRPYRKAMTKEEAIAEISSNSGSQFDPTIAPLFISLIQKMDIKL